MIGWRMEGFVPLKRHRHIDAYRTILIAISYQLAAKVFRISILRRWAFFLEWRLSIEEPRYDEALFRVSRDGKGLRLASCAFTSVASECSHLLRHGKPMHISKASVSSHHSEVYRTSSTPGRGPGSLGFEGRVSSHAGPVVMKKPHGVGSAPNAVAHLRDKSFRGTTKKSHSLRGWRGGTLKRSSRNRDQGNQIVQIGFKARDPLGNGRGMDVVHTGDDHCVHLDDQASCLEPCNRIHLALHQKSRRVQPLKRNVSSGNPRVDHRTHPWINRIDRDGRKPNVQFRERIHVFGYIQPIRRETKVQVGVGPSDDFECCESSPRIGKAIPRTRNACNRDERHAIEHFIKIGRSLLRLKSPACYTRPALVCAIIGSVAVRALYVAGWSHRKMDTAVAASRPWMKTRVTQDTVIRAQGFRHLGTAFFARTGLHPLDMRSCNRRSSCNSSHPGGSPSHRP